LPSKGMKETPRRPFSQAPASPESDPGKILEMQVMAGKS